VTIKVVPEELAVTPDPVKAVLNALTNVARLVVPEMGCE
jgi:hypothetical protein